MFKKGDKVIMVEAYEGAFPKVPGIVLEVNMKGTYLVRFEGWHKGHGPSGSQWNVSPRHLRPLEMENV